MHLDHVDNPELGEAVEGEGEELFGVAGAILELSDEEEGAGEVRGEGEI